VLVTDCAELDDAVVLVVALALVLLAFVLEAAVCEVMVVVSPSRHASTPPSESIDATLSAVAAFRAREARGVRRGREVRVGSSMTVNVRTSGERPPRTG
jgi:hypothetical protein